MRLFFSAFSSTCISIFLMLFSAVSFSADAVIDHRYLDLHPKHQVQIRSVSQINLMAAIFAESVERLLNLQYSQNQTRLVINGVRRV